MPSKTLSILRPALALSLSLSLGACQPPAPRGPGSGPGALPPSASSVGAGPSGGALTAPGLTLRDSLALVPYLDDILKAAMRKRLDRQGAALEPYEAIEDLIPRTESIRFKDSVDAIEAHFNAGEELFEFELTDLDGFGDGLGGKPPNFHRVHRGAHGGPDSTSCRSCHHRGGDDGAGEWTENALVAGDGDRVDSALERNPPALQGGGAIQILAAEITAAFREQMPRKLPTEPVAVQLSHQGVDFGTIRVMPDGSWDTSKLVAIDPDLVVRPFGWKGTHSTLRRFAEEAFQVHHGLNSRAMLDLRMFYGTAAVGTSPATRALAAGLGEGKPDDPDQDRVRYELDDGHLSAIAVYLALLPLPVIDPPRSPDLVEAWREGAQTFTVLGCETCHKPMWNLQKPTWVEHHDQDPSLRKPLTLDLSKDIKNGPPLRNVDVTLAGYPIFPFTDLRRHDMGPELADPLPRGTSVGPHKGDRSGPSIPASYFLTRPLWGLAETGPYLHDGRAVTLHDAVLLHGGEAAQTRDAYKALPPHRQRALEVFLLSLTRLPFPEVTP